MRGVLVAAVCGAQAADAPGEDLAVAHRVVPRLEAVPEAVGREVGIRPGQTILIAPPALHEPTLLHPSYGIHTYTGLDQRTLMRGRIGFCQTAIGHCAEKVSRRRHLRHQPPTIRGAILSGIYGRGSQDRVDIGRIGVSID
jgi:hypothetical protein